MDKIQKALARIEGQVRGIAKMYQDQKKCLDIVQQVAAARAALGRLGRELLQAEACRCMIDTKEKQKFNHILKQLFKS
jgi:DNA-binding FrmR family transcriptional regulator